MKKLVFCFMFLSCLLLTAQNLSVMSYNIRYDNPGDGLNSWDNRKEYLASQLNFYKPDVLGTQEGLHHQLEYLQGVLSDYRYFGVGRDDGDQKGEYTGVFYNTGKLDLLSHNTFWLSETPEKPSKGWDAALNRICTWGIFSFKASGKKFLLLNAHFDHVGEVARAESALLILKKIKELNTENLPVVLTGDFNLEFDSQGVQNILKEMIDSHVQAGKNSFGPKGTFNGFHFDEPVISRIDFIFMSKSGLKVLRSGILSDSKDCRYPSDHLPVYAEFNFSN